MSYLPIQNRLLSLVKAQNHLKEIVERKKSKKFHILKYLPAFFLLFLLESNIIGQTTCGLSNSCLNNTPSSFKCITSSASASTLITGDVLLDATTALTTPQYLIVDGVITFDIDYTFASGSEIVFVSNTSGLIVDASERLTINFSHLHGCDDVWQGIKVLYGGEAVLRGNLIEDANNGLQLAIGSGSTPSQFSAVDNQFNRCYVGIAIGDCGGCAIKTINLFSDGISGNIFDGSGVMIDANSTTPLYGISIINIAPITIGKESANVNVFRGYDGAVLGIRAAGIYSFNSSLNVVNSAFEDIGSLTSASGNSGIQALFFDESSFLNVKGIGGGTLAGATFYNVYTGVTINRGNLKVTDAVFDIMRLGINYSPTPALISPINVTIKDCRLKEYRTAGLNFSWSNTITSSFVISDCTFDDDNANYDPLFGFERYAVLISSSNLSNVSNFSIKDNVFNNLERVREFYLLTGHNRCNIMVILAKTIQFTEDCIVYS